MAAIVTSTPVANTETWRQQKVSWKSVTYTKKEFRETCILFDQEKNLARFIWRTAKMNGMKEVTLGDVEKMLTRADETIWILRGPHEFDQDDPDQRKPTWVMTIDRKRMFAAMMTMTDKGYMSTELRELRTNKEWKQRVWTLLK